jgi:serine/threonine-protein kinase
MVAYFSLAVAMSQRPELNEFDWMSRDIVRALVGLIVIYGLFVPNQTVVLALRAVLMGAAPFITLGLVALAYPERARPLFAELGTPVQVSGTLMLVITGVLLAVYGHHVILGLRRDVFEAKRFGQYRLGARLGGGGMGEVFLAQHALLRRPAALKRVRPSIADDPATLARFEREVQATARLTHPNTIEIYDFGRSSDGSFFYVMEHLRGLDLATIVDRHGPMPPARVVYLLRQACGALAEAHAAGLIHRDLKPANLFASILGGEHDVTKLLDFGMVKQQVETPDMPDLSREGRVRGTPLYMAPEQVRGHALDGRADLYAMGCVAFSLLTGHPPFQADDSVQVMIAHAVHPVPSPKALRPDVPDDLDAVVTQCLAKAPDARPPDASSLARALGRCACASEWDADLARAWWAAKEPNA